MVDISPAAIKEIERLKLNRQITDSPLRLTIKSGGCFGLYYDIEFACKTLVDDDLLAEKSARLLEVKGIKLIVDIQSWKYIEHLQLDYSEDLMGGGFRFYNPQNKKTCGCGISFSEMVKTQA